MTELSLLDVPDIAMLKILEKCNYKSIQCLRKVCQNLRNFIDDSKPDSKFRRITVISSSNSISVDLTPSEDPEEDDEGALNLNYDHHDDGCMLHWDDEGEKFLMHQNFFDVFWNDFKTILNHQKTILNDFWFLIDLGEDSEIPTEKEAAKAMAEKLKEILGPRKFRCELFQMDLLEKEPFLSTLSLMDSQILRQIEISNVEDEVYTELTSEDVGNLEQWKNSRILITNKIQLDVPLDDILRFDTVETRLKTLTSEDVGMLKNEFLRHLETSSCSKSILSDHDLRQSDLVRVLGHPLNPKSYSKQWKFEIPGVDGEVWIQNSYGMFTISIGENSELDGDVEDSDSDDNNEGKRMMLAMLSN